MNRGAIFDLDGLMIDSEPLALQALQLSLAPFGVEISSEQYRHLIGHSRHEVLDYIVKQTGVSVSWEELDSIFTSNLFSILHSDQLQLMPGLLPLLDGLAARQFRLGIASNSSLRHVRITTGRVGIASRFACMVSAEEVPRGKPAPDVYLEAARRLGVEPADCLAFEDSVSGVHAVQAAGIYCVFIPNPDLDLAQLGITFNNGDGEVFSSLSDCYAVLDSVLQRASRFGADSKGKRE